MDIKTLNWLGNLYSRSFSGDTGALEELAKGWGFYDHIVPPCVDMTDRASSTVLVKIDDSVIDK